MPDIRPFMLPYEGTLPRIAAPLRHAGAGSAVLGRVTMGAGAWLGARAVVRADGHYVEIGDGFTLGAGGTVHIAHDVYPTHIGDGVTAGPNCVIHACDIGGGCHLGRDVIILDGSRIGGGAAFADGAVVFPRTALEGGWLYAGLPAKPVRPLEAGELEALREEGMTEEPDTEPAFESPALDERDEIFIAATARLAGRVSARRGVGVWYGCDLDAGVHAIAIGENSNIQDNTSVRCVTRPVRIGRETTLGHNVTAADCEIGDAALVGIGAVIAPGTVIENDVFVAAGARTEPSQRLESGWLYGGSPARKLSRLDTRKRTIVTETWKTYCDYARRYRIAQTEARVRRAR